MATPPTPPRTRKKREPRDVGDRPWLNCRAGAIRLGESRYELMKRAACGQIRTLAVPGQSVKYNAEDIDRVRAVRERRYV